jgi:hypothetical protein
MSSSQGRPDVGARSWCGHDEDNDNKADDDFDNNFYYYYYYDDDDDDEDEETTQGSFESLEAVAGTEP